MFSRRKTLAAAVLLFSTAAGSAPVPAQLPAPPMAAESYPPVAYRYADADGVRVFYREAGPKNAPAILLLHGFPTSSHMYRNLIPILASRYHVIAPDLPGFGETIVPDSRGYRYTFDALAETMDQFTKAIGLDRFAIQVFDYGAPTGFRLALKNPNRITAIVTQNGNAYEEGLSPAWNPIQAYWKDPSAANREALRGFLKADITKWQYTEGAPDPTLIAPEAWLLDQVALDRPGHADIQLDLFGDYKSNVALYPAFQAYFRTARPPLLAVWGKNDPFFLPAGAEAYKRDIPGASVHLYNAGHFALETHVREIGAEILAFLDRSVERPAR